MNHLKNYKKHMFAHRPLSFEYYGEDIENGPIQDAPELSQDVDRELLAEELKLSCIQRDAPVPGRGEPVYFSYWAPCSALTAALREIFCK